MFGDSFEPYHLVILLVVVIVFFVLPFWQIWKKAGFSPLFSLLMPVPLIGLVMLYVLAFAPWKSQVR